MALKSKKSNKPRVCLVLNIAPTYRRGIFSAMEADNDIEFSFFCGAESTDVDSLLDMTTIKGFKRYLRNKFKGEKLVWQKGWMRALLSRCDAYILTGNPGIRSNLMLMILAKLTGRRVYLWSHGLHGNETPMQRRKNMFYMKLATGVMLYGERARNIMIKEGYPAEKITVIYNSLDYNHQYPMRGKYMAAGFMRNFFGNNNPVISFVGRLTPKKSLDKLLEAVALLRLQTIDVNVVLVGAGSQEEKLKEFCALNAIDDRVWFYGECYDEEMTACILQNSWMCVSPGNVGLTAIHALSYGVPVITHNRMTLQMPEVEAVKQGYTGDFFLYNDSHSLSVVIERWARMLSTPSAREDVRRNCYKIVDDVYNPQNQLLKIKNVILRDIKKS